MQVDPRSFLGRRLAQLVPDRRVPFILDGCACFVGAIRIDGRTYYRVEVPGRLPVHLEGLSLSNVSHETNSQFGKVNK